MLLFLLSIILSVLIIPIAYLIIEMRTVLKKGKGLKYMNRKFRQGARIVDEFANVIIPTFWTWLFKASCVGVPYGMSRQTISYVLASDQEINNLSKGGNLMVVILEKVDPGHMQKALNYERNFRCDKLANHNHRDFAYSVCD